MSEIPDGEPLIFGRDFDWGKQHVCDEACEVAPSGWHLPENPFHPQGWHL